MGAKDVRAGKAFVELGVTDKTQAALNKVAAKFKSFGAGLSKAGLGITAIGSAVTGPLALAAKVFDSMGSAIHDASARTGVAADQLSTLKFAAEQSGGSMEDLETALKKMSKTLVGADDESKQAVATLDKLGVSIADLKGLTPDEQFRKIGAALNGMTDATKRSAAAQAIFGKSGTSLLPMLDGLAAAEQRARDLGIVITPEQADAADQFGDSLNEVWLQFKAITFQAGAAVAQALQPYFETTTKILRTAIDWVKNNGRLIVTVGAIASAVVAAGVGLVALGTAFSSIGVVIGAAASAIGVVGTVLGAVLSPIGLVVAALGGLAAWFLTSTQTGAEALKWLGDRFNELTDVAKDAFSGIGDALAAGDIKLAGQILWESLKIVWFKGVGALKTIMAGLGIAWESIINGITVAWIKAFALLKSGIIEVRSLHESAVAETTKVIDEFKTRSDFRNEANKKRKEQGKPLLKDTGGKFTADEQAELDRRLKPIQQANDQQHKAAQDQIDADRKALEEKTAAELAAATQIHEAKLKQIEEEQRAGVAGADERLKQAQDELAALKAQAAKERKEVSLGGGPGKPVAPDLADAVDSSVKSIAARGTFNAAALQSLQSSPIQDRIMKAAELTAKNTGRLLNSGGLA